MEKQQKIMDAVRDYGKRLSGFIRSRVKSSEDAEDILQDVWVQLSTVLDVEPVGQLSAWLYRVTRNRIIDRQRKYKAELPEIRQFENEEGEMDFGGFFPADDNTPETEFERAHFREQLFAALNALPQKQREVFVWNELEEMTLQQIADQTGENIKTIISRKRYAVAHLREWFQKLYNE
jgi:RNA polymerase sigma factor (sigma-70 family)